MEEIGTPKSGNKDECLLPPRPIKITPIFSKKNAELVQLEDETIKEESSSSKTKKHSF